MEKSENKEQEKHCSECYSYDNRENGIGEGYCWHWYEFVKPTREACKEFL